VGILHVPRPIAGILSPVGNAKNILSSTDFTPFVKHINIFLFPIAGS